MFIYINQTILLPLIFLFFHLYFVDIGYLKLLTWLPRYGETTELKVLISNEVHPDSIGVRNNEIGGLGEPLKEEHIWVDRADAIQRVKVNSEASTNVQFIFVRLDAKDIVEGETDPISPWDVKKVQGAVPVGIGRGVVFTDEGARSAGTSVAGVNFLVIWGIKKTRRNTLCNTNTVPTFPESRKSTH